MVLITHSSSTFKANFGNNLNGDDDGPIVLGKLDHDENSRIVVDYASQREHQLKPIVNLA
jgi:hypothetical protein